jgi:hypothetical protein
MKYRFGLPRFARACLFLDSHALRSPLAPDGPALSWRASSVLDIRAPYHTMSELLNALNPAVIRKRSRDDYERTSGLPDTLLQPVLVRRAIQRSELEDAMSDPTTRYLHLVGNRDETRLRIFKGQYATRGRLHHLHTLLAHPLSHGILSL